MSKHHAKYWINQWLILWLWFFCLTTHALTTEDLQLGKQLTMQGQPQKAIHHWQQLLAQKPNTEVQVEILLQLAQAYQTLGFSQKAKNTLEQALSIAQSHPLQQAVILNSLSDLALATRQYHQARKYVNQSLNRLPKNASAEIQAALLNNLGNVLIVEAYYEEAIKTYSQALQKAEKTEKILLQTRILSNMAYAYFKNNQQQQALSPLEQARQLLQSSTDNYAKTFGLINLGELAQRILHFSPNSYPLPSHDKHLNLPETLHTAHIKQLRQLAYQLLNDALELARQHDQSRLVAYAAGYLGQMYEIEQQYEQSLELTRLAIFHAQLSDAKEILYRWEWQLARLFKAQNQFDQAIEAYRQAVDNLQEVREELKIGYRNTAQSFRDTVGPVYFELADLLLQRAQSSVNSKKWLIEARDTIERFKTVELQEYFQDDCVTESQVQSATLSDNTGLAHTAILYPILLPDRTEILLSLPQGIQQFSISIPANRLKDEVNEFRFELETRETKDYLPYAQRLYHWLISPLEPALKQQAVDTLIVVPDGVLRTIPLTALHNGKQFLNQKYAIVTTPGLTLTDTQPANWQKINMLINGLSESVAGYSPLSSVQQEVEKIHLLYPQRSTILLNKHFTVDRFAQALEETPYSIVHIASHGQFNSDPQKTFLLTYQGKLTMNRLEELIRLSKIRNEPMELLTMSACQTAVGDDQAALGLAGIALKAGARSALATLWYVDDAATAELVTEFYRQLKINNISKAKALQRAQQHLIQQPRYQHPIFWAPFLLVGNWL